MHMTMAMYCAEGSTPKAKPTPDSAGLFTTKDLESLAKQRPDVIVPLVSAGLARVHTVGQPLLQHMPKHNVREEVVAVGTLIVRLLSAKALTLEVSPAVADAAQPASTQLTETVPTKPPAIGAPRCMNEPTAS